MQDTPCLWPRNIRKPWDPWMSRLLNPRWSCKSTAWCGDHADTQAICRTWRTPVWDNGALQSEKIIESFMFIHRRMHWSVSFLHRIRESQSTTLIHQLLLTIRMNNAIFKGRSEHIIWDTHVFASMAIYSFEVHVTVVQ